MSNDPDMEEELHLLWAALDAQTRHLEHIIEVVRAAERLFFTLTENTETLTAPTEEGRALRNLGEAMKAAYQ